MASLSLEAEAGREPGASSPTRDTPSRGTFLIGNTTYTVDAPWFFTDARVFEANQYRELTAEERIIDASSFLRDDFENRCIRAISQYCTDVIGLCTDFVNQARLDDDFPSEVIKLHTDAMRVWMCARYYDSYSVKRHAFSVVGQVGWCYLWLRFIDQFFELHTCTPQASATASWRGVDAWNLVFKEYMFTDTNMIHDTYNSVCWERIQMRLRLAPQLRQEAKEAKERDEKQQQQQHDMQHAPPATQLMVDNGDGIGADEIYRHTGNLHNGTGESASSIRANAARAAAMLGEEIDPEEMRQIRNASIMYREPAEQTLESRFMSSNGTDTANSSNSYASRAKTVAAEVTKAAMATVAAAAAASSTTAVAAAAAAASDDTFDEPQTDNVLPVLAPGQTYKEYVDSYCVPHDDMCFEHHGQLEGSSRDIRKLIRIFDILVKKIHFGSVHHLDELTTNEQWRELLHTLECVCIILFIQFHHLDHQRIEAYTRMTVWIESQLAIREQFAIEELDFCDATYGEIDKHLDGLMECDPDPQLLDTINKCVYLHRMPCGIPYLFFQKNPFQTVKRNPVSILNEELPEHALRYMNDHLLHAKPRDIFGDRKNPFYNIFVFVLFACNLRWNKNQYDWMGTYNIFNFHLIQNLAALHRDVDNNGREKRPYLVPLLGRRYVLSMWRRVPGGDRTEMMRHPTLYQCNSSQHEIATWFWTLLYDFNGHLEDGYALGRYAYDFFKFEALQKELSQFKSILDGDSDDDDDDEDNDDNDAFGTESIEAAFRRIVVQENTVYDASTANYTERFRARDRMVGVNRRFDNAMTDTDELLRSDGDGANYVTTEDDRWQMVAEGEEEVYAEEEEEESKSQA